MNTHVDPRLAAGANAPPLADQLAVEEAALVADVQAVADRANALPRALTPETADASVAAIGAVLKDCAPLTKRLETRRVAVKQPWLDGSQTVDKFFGDLKLRLQRIDGAFTKLVADFRESQRQEAARIAAEAQRKAQEEQRAAEATKRKALEEAEAAAAKGRQNTAALAQARAAEAAEAARAAQVQELQAQAQATVAAAPPPPAAVKTEIAPDVTMATKGDWQGRVVNRALIDFNLLGPYFKMSEIEDALKRAVKNGVRECGGAEIKFGESVSFK